MVDRSFQKTVYVLGAGCSKNYEKSEAFPELEPPLDKDFFEMAAKVLLEYDKIPEKFKNLISATRSLYHLESTETNGILKEWLTNSMSLESTFTFIDLKTEYEEGVPRRAFETAYQELVKMMRLTFYRTLKGPSCPVHRELAKRIQNDDTVMSYNYDILADNALFEDCKINERNYLVPFGKVYYQGKWMNPRESLSRIKLVKLHGSLNWLSCRRCSLLFCFLGEKTPENYSLGTPASVKCPNPDCNSNELEHVLIPPVLNKDYDLPGMKLLWKTAEAELGSADRVVVIGYSLPPTDFRSELLLDQR